MSLGYLNNFSDWDSVLAEYFGVYTYDDGWKEDTKFINIKEKHPEPDEVLVADYKYECYEGQSYVVYRRGDKYFEQSGSHCSCYGLEDQWDEDEDTKGVPLAVFLAALEQRTDDYGAEADHRPALIALLRQRLGQVHSKL